MDSEITFQISDSVKIEGRRIKVNGSNKPLVWKILREISFSNKIKNEKLPTLEVLFVL